MNEVPPVRPQITRTNTIRCTDDVIAKVDALTSVYGMTAYSEVWILALSVFYELLAAATRIRERFGLETARDVLGHSSLSTTLIYAAENARRAAEAIRLIG